MLDSVHNHHLVMSCHIHTIIISTNAYREKKNCKGLSVMVCNAFVTLADGK